MIKKNTDPLKAYEKRVESALRRHLTVEPANALFNAMQYSTLEGGKRLRAKLVYATGEALDAPIAELDVAAAAIEMVHSFSLIHDDLPAMDDDELRRGKPTCHVAFGEATAILAGDALLAHAFDVLSSEMTPHFDPTVRLEMVQVLARATGGLGMTAGQYLDVQAENMPLNFAQLVQIHTLKTGCLIRASIELGFLASPRHHDKTLRNNLRQFAEYIGLAFQIQDDILDVIGDTVVLGKTTRRDEELEKATYPKAMGVSAAQNEVVKAYKQALKYIDDLGDGAQKLRILAEQMVYRDK